MEFGTRHILRWFQQCRRLKLRERHAEWAEFVPPGHFPSPLPSRAEIAAAFSRGVVGDGSFADVELNEAGQVARLERFAEFYAEQPYPEKATEGRRFHLDNPSYGSFDAIMLWLMLREAQPQRIIEVGSGFSSAAMLDARDHGGIGTPEFTFIDPDMARLRPLLRTGDKELMTLIERIVQDVPLGTFAELSENDVLFIDSSHVSKIGSDVNRLFFDVFPTLAPGVLIHIHDVTAILEYPREWLDEGRAWNEQYVLRAFLMNNPVYRVELFTAWLLHMRHEWFCQHMPLCVQGGGGQLWLRKVARPALSGG